MKDFQIKPQRAIFWGSRHWRHGNEEALAQYLATDEAQEALESINQTADGLLEEWAQGGMVKILEAKEAKEAKPSTKKAKTQPDDDAYVSDPL